MVASPKLEPFLGTIRDRAYLVPLQVVRAPSLRPVHRLQSVFQEALGQPVPLCRLDVKLEIKVDGSPLEAVVPDRMAAHHETRKARALQGLIQLSRALYDRQDSESSMARLPCIISKTINGWR